VETLHINGCSIMMSAADNLPSMHSRTRSFACLSDSTTDIDEFFDAFDDEEDMNENFSERTITMPEDISYGADGRNSQAAIGQLAMSESHDINKPSTMKNSNATTFHTARDQTYTAAYDITINDSISTLSPDSDEDRTL